MLLKLIKNLFQKRSALSSKIVDLQHISTVDFDVYLLCGWQL